MNCPLDVACRTRRRLAEVPPQRRRLEKADKSLDPAEEGAGLVTLRQARARRSLHLPDAELALRIGASHVAGR